MIPELSYIHESPEGDFIQHSPPDNRKTQITFTLHGFGLQASVCHAASRETSFAEEAKCNTTMITPEHMGWWVHISCNTAIHAQEEYISAPCLSGTPVCETPCLQELSNKAPKPCVF